VKFNQIELRADKELKREQKKKLKEITKKGRAITNLLTRGRTEAAEDEESEEEEEDKPLQILGVCRALASGSNDETIRFWNFAWQLEKAEKKRILEEAKQKKTRKYRKGKNS